MFITGPTISEENGKSSNSPPIIILTVAVAAASLGLLFCIIVLICAIIICLKKKRNNSHGQIIPPVLPIYDTVDGRKCSAENVYEQISTTYRYSTIKRTESVPPVPPPFPKHFKTTASAVNLLKPEQMKINCYYSCAEFNKNFSGEEQIELQLDIYDDIVPLSKPQLIHEYFCEDIYYLEAFDCNNPDNSASNRKSNVLSMCVPIYNEPTPLKRNEAPKLIEWNNINVLTKIGEGEFGDVFLAETTDAVESKPKALVAIKTLKGDYSATMKQQFEKEIKFMTRLKNAHVVQLLGICNKGTPFIMMEYMSNGDLHMFLRKHYLPDIGKDIAEAVIPIHNVILQYVALQIANGMRYLASYGFIHRDLAARNCLVGEDYVVKIADFGMTQDLYNEAYFIMRGKAIVPIRWMAPESFFGRFSTKTDVWSYGVTLWEIFTLCRNQPYSEMTDEQLVNDVQKGGKRILLERPPYIPDKVHDIMLQCWMHNPTQRPDFGSVYNQLLDYYMLNCEH